MKRIHATSALALAALLALAGSRVDAQSRHVTIGAGPAPMKALLAPIEKDFESKTGIDLELYEDLPGSGFGADLDTGKADGVITGLDRDHWLEVLKKSGRPWADAPDSYKQRVVGHDLLHVIAHQGVGVESLDRGQLKDLFSGTAKDWSTLGGARQPIVLVLADETPGINIAFQSTVLGSEPFGGSIVRAKAFTDVWEMVQSTPGAVGFIPRRFSKPGPVILETPTIGRPYYLITKGRPSPELEELVGFLKHSSQP